MPQSGAKGVVTEGGRLGGYAIYLDEKGRVVTKQARKAMPLDVSSLLIRYRLARQRSRLISMPTAMMRTQSSKLHRRLGTPLNRARLASR